MVEYEQLWLGVWRRSFIVFRRKRQENKGDPTKFRE